MHSLPSVGIPMDQYELSRRAAERHAVLTAVRERRQLQRSVSRLRFLPWRWQRATHGGSESSRHGLRAFAGVPRGAP